MRPTLRDGAGRLLDERSCHCDVRIEAIEWPLNYGRGKTVAKDIETALARKRIDAQPVDLFVEFSDPFQGSRVGLPPSHRSAFTASRPRVSDLGLRWPRSAGRICGFAQLQGAQADAGRRAGCDADLRFDYQALSGFLPGLLRYSSIPGLSTTLMQPYFGAKV